MNSTNKELEDDSMLYVSFNQDYSCFAIGTERGFKIYPTYPFKECYERKMNGGIGLAEMLYRSNFLALVGGGKVPKYNKKKVVIWDDHQGKVVCELKFTASVKNVKLKKDKVFIVCEKKLFIFDSDTYQNIDDLDTRDNPKGIIAVNNDPNFTVLAFPYLSEKEPNKGYVFIKNYEKNKNLELCVHDDPVSYMCMNFDGTLLATANEKGTVIRIHSCSDGAFLQELKRGKEKAEINYICFDNESKFMATTSNRGTVHIWSMSGSLKKLKESEINETKKEEGIVEDNKEKGNSSKEIKEEDALPENKRSVFGKINIIGDYFKKEYSFAQVRLTEQNSICAFGPDNIIIIITSEGKYYQAKMDLKKGGDCQIILEKNL